MRRAASALAALLALAACARDSDPAPGGVTRGEARQLDDAAEALDHAPRAPLVDATVPADISGDTPGAAPARKAAR